MRQSLASAAACQQKRRVAIFWGRQHTDKRETRAVAGACLFEPGFKEIYANWLMLKPSRTNSIS